MRGATLYQLQVATKIPTSRASCSTPTSATTKFQTVSRLDYNTYWWRGAGRSATGLWSDWSLVSMFELTLLKTPKNAAHVLGPDP